MTCRYLGTCGGCSLAAPYPAQLADKRARLARLFPDVPVTLTPSPVEERFRHKVAFTFDPASTSPRIVMGHYRAGSRQVVAVDVCPAHSDRGNQLAFALRDRLAAGRVPEGILRHVLIRTTDDQREAVMMLVVRANHKSLRGPVRGLLDSPEGPDGFFLNIHDRPGPYLIGDVTQRIAGRSHVREEMLGHSFLISPTAFFQTNVRAARELLRLVLAEASGARQVLDLYSGSGLFSIPLARQGAQVTAIESHRPSVEDAQANLRLNRLPHDRVRLIAARTEDALPRALEDAPDLVILDPPRQGCPDRVIEWLGRAAVPRIVYVSCDPARLADEVPRFRAAGQVLRRVSGVDMFPHTDHLEAVAVLSPATEADRLVVRPTRRRAGTRPPESRLRAGRPRSRSRH